MSAMPLPSLAEMATGGLGGGGGKGGEGGGGGAGGAGAPGSVPMYELKYTSLSVSALIATPCSSYGPRSNTVPLPDPALASNL